MRLQHTAHAREQFIRAPSDIRRAFRKQIKFLLQDLRHPSLRAKKYDRTNDIWQARITRGWRFYFRIEDDRYLILALMQHSK